MNFAVVTVALASLVGAHALDTGRTSFMDGVSYAGYAPSTASWARLAAVGLAPKSALQYNNAAASRYATFAPEAATVLVNSPAAADASEPTYVLKAGLAYPESTANLNGAAVAPETAFIVKAYPKSTAFLNGLFYKTGSFAPEASMTMNSVIAPETAYIVRAHPKSAALLEILPKTGSFYPESAVISKASSSSFAPEGAIVANSAIAPESAFIVKAQNARIVPESAFIVKAKNAQIVPESTVVLKAENAALAPLAAAKSGLAYPAVFFPSQSAISNDEAAKSTVVLKTLPRTARYHPEAIMSLKGVGKVAAFVPESAPLADSAYVPVTASWTLADSDMPVASNL